MSETIEKIEEVVTYENEGYLIETDKAKYTVYVGGEKEGQCCESWGYMSTDDNLDEYIGAELLSIEEVDDDYATKQIRERDGKYIDEGGDTCFVRVNTSKGMFTLAVYNAHNGYYGHSIGFERKEK